MNNLRELFKFWVMFLRSKLDREIPQEDNFSFPLNDKQRLNQGIERDLRELAENRNSI